MDPLDEIAICEQDRLYVEAFCQKYKTQVVDIFPNTEEFPPQGLMYMFDNQLGGFSIEGIKKSLEDKIAEERLIKNGFKSSEN